MPRPSFDYMLDPPEDPEECDSCGEYAENCECGIDVEPDDFVSDEDADMAADRYFGDL